MSFMKKQDESFMDEVHLVYLRACFCLLFIRKEHIFFLINNT